MVRETNFINKMEIDVMTFTKLTSLTLITTAIFGISASANADDLKFYNNTPYNLSFSVQGACSNELGNMGENTTKVIDKGLFNEVCKSNPSQCFIEVYKEVDCAGKSVAGLVFDEYNYVPGGAVVPFGSDVSASGDSSNVFFNKTQPN